ncbi:MAG: DUF2842 domain-containing protein [Rhodobacteraceae bacterium]|nr:DUF2842 domain-containing protein [Paracoccaceae bacterium]
MSPSAGLSYRARRRWALVILLLGLPLYIIAAVTVMNLLGRRPPFWVEFAVYMVLGLIWALPFRYIFRGIGQADPQAADRDLQE